MKKDVFKNIKKDKKFLLKIVAIINIILAVFIFISRIVFVKYLNGYIDIGLDSDFVVPAIIEMDMLSFDLIALVLIATFTVLGLFKNEKGMLITAMVLTMLVSICSLSYNLISYVQNPFSSTVHLIINILLIVLWNVITYFAYKNQKSMLDKIM